MTLEETLLKQAREARDALINREWEMDRAREKYHKAIEQLYGAGGSLREIADGLGLSHQRVHQIVESLEEKKAARKTKFRECAFCGQPESQVGKLVPGPYVFICDRCVGLARTVMATGKAKKNKWTALSEETPDGEANCWFCGRGVKSVDHLIVGRVPPSPGKHESQVGRVCICDICLGLAERVLAEQAVT
jgi:hypothetical protein